MHIFQDIKTLIAESVAEEIGMTPSQFSLERPRDESHGELATNVSMVVAKAARRNPRALAASLASRLSADDRIKSVEVAGPGFINLRLTSSVWFGVLPDVLKRGEDFGRNEIYRNKKINLEFVSANPTGPLHVGHARGAIFGDALGRLLEYCGADVFREYYVNDGGAQIDTLARSTYARYLQACGVSVELEGGAYAGEYLIPLGRSLFEKYGKRFVESPESIWLRLFRQAAIRAMMDIIRNDLAALGIKMDNFFSERSLYGNRRIEDAIEELDRRGLIFQGTLAPPRGKAAEGWEPRVQTLFRSTEHGDDTDRPVRKADGSWSYFAPDIAYHYDKIMRGFDVLINVFGADHGGYTKRIKAAVSALSDGTVPLEIKLIHLVKIVERGRTRRMSTRSGEFVPLQEVVDVVGPDVARFVMLMRKNDVPLEFDFDAVRDQSRENPVFYVQYAHARICSVLRRAALAGINVEDSSLQRADLSDLGHSAELALMRRIAEWPRIAEVAASKQEPHRIAHFLFELASDFHALWTRGSESSELRFIQPQNLDRSRSKVALIRGAAIVIAAGLGILGVEPVQEMRS